MGKKDKDHLIKIGQELFNTQGYYNTGTEQILQKADYPRSSFYHHFKSKEGFAAKVLEHYGNNAEQYYNSVLTDEKLGSPLMRLKILTSLMVDSLKKHSFNMECLIQKFSIECAANSEFLRESTNQQMNKVLNTIKDCIILGQAENKIRTDIEAIKLAEFFQAQWYGAYILGRLQKDVSVFETNMNMAFSYLKG